jgi:peptidoglycan-associated lipoprotein
MRQSLRTLLLAAPFLIATTACHRKRPVAVTPSAVATPDDSAERERREAEAREAAARRAEQERLRAEQEAAERARAGARAALEANVFFAFDRSDLDAEARTTLDGKLSVLQASPGIRIRVAGHTDDRGSDEYNLALGARRAMAAKRYLTQRGIDEGRIEIVSFGAERPTCEVPAESCWGQNRRDEFVITVGTVAAAPAASLQP